MVKKNIRVCCGMTCSVMGSGKVMKKIEEATGLKPGEKNEEIDLNYCSCTGNCHLAPSVVVNGNFVHEANPDTIMNEIETAALKEPQESTVTDATIDEILNNDFLGDV
jgi:NADH:ubiquinone oxidoreductase subunit E